MRYDELINESGLSKIYRRIKDHDYGIITASRARRDCGDGERYTYAENKQRNASLLAKLRVKGYSVTSIRGSYIENYGSENAVEVGENSFFVVDLENKGTLRNSLVELGEEFEQDCILYGEAGKNGVLIGTNKCPNGYPGYGVEAQQGGAVFGKDGEFMSRVKGRPFVFAESVEMESYGVCRYPTELRGPATISKLHWSKL